MPSSANPALSVTVCLPLAALCAMLCICASCGSPTDSTRQPDVLHAVAGNGQTGLAGFHERDSVSVRLMTGNGLPRAGRPVVWTVVSGGGSVSPATTLTNANGVASTAWTLGALGPQSLSAAIEGANSPPVTFTATAIVPVVAIRYDGATWRTELADSNQASIRLASVWGTSPTALFAVGTSSGSGPLTLRLNAGSWSSARTIAISSVGSMTSISGRTMSDVYETRSWALPPSGGREVAHYDGQGWSASYSDNCSFSCLDALNGLWISTGADAFTVGNRGLALRYDGTAWSPQVTGTTASLRGVWGADPDHVFAVGDNGTILFYDGTSWTTQASGVTETLNAIWGRSASDVFAVGSHGTVMHFDGSQWAIQSSNTTEDLFGVSGSGAHVFAVGNNSTALQYDGSRWLAYQFAIPIDLRGISVFGGEAVAVGAPPLR